MTSVLLGLETSGPVASVAVSVAGQVVARRILSEQRRHAVRLLPAVDEVMSTAQVRKRDLTGVVVGTGPGSFTGVRVAATSGKGMAHALQFPLYAVSSLLAAALAEILSPSVWDGWPFAASEAGSSEVDPRVSSERVVLFDARGERLFCAVFRLSEGEVEILAPPSFRHLPELLADRSLDAALHCGSGATRHAGALREEGRAVLPAPMGVPSADGLLLHMAGPSAPAPLERPFDWEPDYLRETGAVRGRAP